MKDIVFGFLIVALIIFGVGLKFFSNPAQTPPAKPFFDFFNLEPARRTDKSVEYTKDTRYIARTRFATKLEARFINDKGEEQILMTNDTAGQELQGALDPNLGSGVFWVRAYNAVGEYSDTEHVQIMPMVVEPVKDFSSEIQVEFPLAEGIVKSPLVVKGKVRGTWFFEASMPITLLDANNKVLVKMPLQASSDWMTTEFVPFEGEIIFIKPSTASGTLLFENDNPSGMPEHAKSFAIPVRFE